MNFTRKEILKTMVMQSPIGRGDGIRSFTYQLLEDHMSFLRILENIRDCINADIDFKGSETLHEINTLLEE